MKESKYPYIFGFIAIFIITYLYFLGLKTTTIYGDDLLTVRDIRGLKGFFGHVNMSVSVQKYRPVNGVALNTIAALFQKHLGWFYFFNILIQAINTVIFARILNLFLKSVYLSLGISLVYGLSRFLFYNVAQLFYGGALEGLAMAFFLLFLFFILKAFVQDDLSAEQKYKDVLRSILFANLCIYTHERYIALFVFIILAVLLSYNLKGLSTKQKLGLCAAAVFSIVLNVVIKKYIFAIPFFVGTGGTTMQFSLSQAISFFIDGVLSIMCINSGPDYLVGAQFSSLPALSKLLAVLAALAIVVTAVLYFRQTIKRYVVYYVSKVVDSSALKVKPDIRESSVFLYLIIAFVLVLVPATFTIRLEQRWLQASFCVFILMLVIALNTLFEGHKSARNIVLAAVALLFFITDFTYLKRGKDNIYMANSHHQATKFRLAMEKGVIHPGTKNIYVVETPRDGNVENDFNWILAGGEFFAYYQNDSKTLVFTDSVYKRSVAGDSTLLKFNKATDQMILIKDSIIDLTDRFAKDSLKDMLK
jgi:hypothetical protein